MKKSLPLNLQFFAEDNNGGDNNNDNQDNSGSKSGEKTFTQEEVNRMMATEKNEGRKAVLNALGVKDVDEAKKAIDYFNSQAGSNDNTNLGKEPDVNKELEEKKNDAEQRALAAENKLACVLAGVSKDSVDDVLSIAMSKVTDEKKLSTVLEEMKSVAKYSGFFGTEEEKKGTGSDVGHIGKGNNGQKGMAQRLAEQNKPNQNNKKSYF